MSSRAALLALAMLVCGCAPIIDPISGPRPVTDARTAAGWEVVHEDWNPPQGIDWAVADCNAKASATGGYDWIDAHLRRGEVLVNCMKAYGYARR